MGPEVPPASVSGASEALEAWVQRQYRRSLRGMLAAISPTSIVKQRAGFGQTIRPRRGAIVASPILAAYDPDPDYFFHWYRDSALVIDALRVAYQDGIVGDEALTHLLDFIDFSRALRALDGRSLARSSAWREAVAADFRQYLRPPEELAEVYGEAVAAETRVNADATLDITRWGRPQHDGPALRALALLRWWRPLSAAVGTASVGALCAASMDALSQLLLEDLAYVRRHAHEACFDIWEEEHGWHYYTLRVSAAALEQGADWLVAAAGGAATATAAGAPALDVADCRAQARVLLAMLDELWYSDGDGADASADGDGHDHGDRGAAGYYRSRRLSSGQRSEKELDIAVVLAPLHAGASRGAHSVQDPRVHATLERLERLFAALYPINRQRPVGRGAALGRYATDRYYSGGAYYFSTLAAAECCYRAAASAAAGADAARGAALRARGDAFLEMVRAFTPADGQLSEQFDQRTGVQTSARELGWSYAAFITCSAARTAARTAAAVAAVAAGTTTTTAR
jgi:GH15 family glucan-1,4-alpha-glucosidase